MVTLPSGVLYKVLTASTKENAKTPSAADQVKVHYASVDQAKQHAAHNTLPKPAAIGRGGNGVLWLDVAC